MESKELIYRVVKAIQFNAELAPIGQGIQIDPWGQHLNGIPDIQLNQIFQKLESDEKVIRIGYKPEWDGADHYFIYEMPTFREYARKIIEDFESNTQQPEQFSSISGSNTSLKITYSEQIREIVLNGIFLLAKPDFDSENEKVFTYLYKNPGKRITVEELVSQATGGPLKKDLHDIARDLGFSKDLKVFMSISKGTIIFHNPVNLSDLDQKYIKIGPK